MRVAIRSGVCAAGVVGRMEARQRWEFEGISWDGSLVAALSLMHCGSRRWELKSVEVGGGLVGW